MIVLTMWPLIIALIPLCLPLSRFCFALPPNPSVPLVQTTSLFSLVPFIMISVWSGGRVYSASITRLPSSICVCLCVSVSVCTVDKPQPHRFILARRVHLSMSYLLTSFLL